MNKKPLLFIFAVIFSSGICLAQSDELMDRAVKEYLRGDYLGAIQDFDRILEMEENEKASKLLYKSVVEEGKRRINNGDYKKAQEYLERAREIDPSDTEVNSLLSDVEKMTGKETKALPAADTAVDELKSRIREERSAKNTYARRLNSITAQRDQLRKEREQNKQELAAAREKITGLEARTSKTSRIFIIFAGIGAVVFLAVFAVAGIMMRKIFRSSSSSNDQLQELQEKISSRLKEAEEESEELEERVARSINSMIDGQKQVVKQISQSAAGKTQSDIEELKDGLFRHFEEQQTKLIELLNMQARALSSEETEKVEIPGEDGRVITDVNPHVRARADGVELIPKTVTDPNVAEKLIRPYLSDPNNRVRANAAVAIYQYNPEASVQALKSMADNSDKWMRLSAAWAVGEIASPEVVPILRKLLDDIDERVKDRAMKSFENMAEVKEDVASEIRKMINRNKRNRKYE